MKNILILAGPSGVGKTTLAHALLKDSDRFELVRSVTSREPRGDSFDAEYIYLSRRAIEELIENGGVLEYTDYASNLYGTPRSEIDRILADGRVPLLVLDLVGVHTVVNTKSDLSPCAVYLTAPEEELAQRLRKRYGADIEKLNSRLEKNKTDKMLFEKIKDDFFAIVENAGNVEICAKNISSYFERFCG